MRLRAKLTLTALALLAVASCGKRADEAAVPSIADAVEAAPVETGPALWRTGDADTTVYLFGTVHVLRPDLSWRTERVDRALEASKAIYFETDVNPNPGQMMQVVSRLGVYVPPEKLSDKLAPEDRAALADAASKLSLPMFMLDTMRPWLAAMALSEQLIVKAGYEPTSGVERTLEPEARAAGREIRKFETVEQQLLFFADLPETVQIAYLMEGVREIDKETTLLDDMVAAWARGDVATLENIMIEGDLAESPEIYEALLVKRNRNWAATLDTLIKTETGVVFVAVGAGHLAGNDSVITLLMGRGYMVDRVE
ncbi:MAG: TraB/GumN family protein [Alphaproteobacteria bacterium]|nr:TraB/GumN family protein [Alphaproteobacteria bacterium]